MGTLAAQNPTLLDVTSRTDPNGAIATIAEIMNQESPIIEDGVWIEGNLPTGHRTTVRTGLPEPTWRKLYGGVQPTKSKTTQVTDSCGMLEDYAEIDKALADLNGNTAAFRLSEDRAHIEGIAQKIAKYTIYGNESTEPEAFTGLAPRYNSLSAANKDNIINAGGSGSDNTSIYLCVWGQDTGHFIYPKGSTGGLQMNDKGQVTVENADGNGGRMEGYRSHYRHDVGLSIRDWRYFGRICNIDVSDLDTLANTKNLITWMIQMSERIPNLGKGRAVWYLNRTLREKLRLGILEKVSSNLSWESVEGKRVMTFADIPVHRLDAILNTETTVS